jgi:class 3 adenylate cyclase
MEKMKTSRLFTKTLILIVILFGVIATATSVLSGWTLYRGLTGEYQSKGIAIAKSVADSSAEILLNRDLSTVQAIIDQFGEIGGVAYVFVSDGQGEIVSHTFVPAVPTEVLPLIEQSRASPSTGEVVTTKLQFEGLGDFIHIYAPILAGVAGFVHVGMDEGFIRAQIWSTVVKQQGVMFAILLLSIVVAYILVNRISRPLNQLADYTHSLASHDFAVGLDVPAEIEALSQKSKDEVGKLAESFVYMERTLRQYLKDLKETTAANERLGRLRRFFSPQLAEMIVEGGTADPLKTHRREVTVVFLDLRGFTAFAETVEPEEVMSVLREYHAEMGKLILEHEGTLERFTGDGMMIFFNDPMPVPNPAERAIRMAVAMREGVRQLSAVWRKLDYDLGFGIGVDQGYATIGAIGFEGRWDYGAIGTVTNLAARLCGEAKADQVLVSRRLAVTMEELVEVESVGELMLKGFQRPVSAFNVVRLREN